MVILYSIDLETKPNHMMSCYATSTRTVSDRNLLCCLLLLLLSAPLPCISIVGEEPATSQEASTGQQQRQTQDDANTSSNNPCSLCQGLTLLADKIPDIPNPREDPTITCADMNTFFQQPDFENRGDASILSGLENTTTNNPGTCRADYGFNVYFEACCKASIPQYECEQNIHDIILGDFKINNYNSAVPPIVDYDEKLIVSVFLRYEALESVEVEEGEWVDALLY